MKGLLGVQIDKQGFSPTQAGVVDDYIQIFHNLHTVRLPDAVLGICCVIVLLAMRVSLDLY